MKNHRFNLLRWPAVIASLLTITSVKADFSGSYALTPVLPGIYGAWTATIGSSGGVIDVSGAPDQLQLGVPTGSIVANVLDFETSAAADGTVSFDALMVGVGNDIFWFSPGGGANPVYVPLDQALPGLVPGPVSPVPFSFPVQAGDRFGFELVSGSDAIPPGAPLMITLTVQHFSGPVPEPGALAFSASTLLVLAARFRRRK